MRTLAMLLAAAALSWAHGATAQEMQQREEGMTGQKAQEQQPGQEMKEQGAQAEPKAPAMSHEAKAEKRSRFEGSTNYDVEGKISKVGRDSVSLTREGLPVATLKVSKETKIEVDGSTASIKQLKQGQDVKASFNLEGERPLALEIKAQKAQPKSETQTPAQEPMQTP